MYEKIDIPKEAIRVFGNRENKTNSKDVIDTFSYKFFFPKSSVTFVPFELIDVHENCQRKRESDDKKLMNVFDKFDPELCKPLELAYNESSDRYELLDGTGRLEIFYIKKLIPLLEKYFDGIPCLIVTKVKDLNECRKYFDQNYARVNETKISGTDKIYTKINDDYEKISNIMENHKMRLGRIKRIKGNNFITTQEANSLAQNIDARKYNLDFKNNIESITTLLCTFKRIFDVDNFVGCGGVCRDMVYACKECGIDIQKFATLKIKGFNDKRNKDYIYGFTKGSPKMHKDGYCRLQKKGENDRKLFIDACRVAYILSYINQKCEKNNNYWFHELRYGKNRMEQLCGYMLEHCKDYTINIKELSFSKE